MPGDRRHLRRPAANTPDRRSAAEARSRADHDESDALDGRHRVQCPYCGEWVEVYLEADVRGTLVQDCEVCCNPWQVRVRGRGDRRTLSVGRADGSE